MAKIKSVTAFMGAGKYTTMKVGTAGVERILNKSTDTNTAYEGQTKTGKPVRKLENCVVDIEYFNEN